MAKQKHQEAIAAFASHEAIQEAFAALQQAVDFPRENLSMIVRDFEDAPTEPLPLNGKLPNEASRGTAIGSVTGTALGMAGGLAIATASSVVLPGIGAVLVAGPLGAVITTLAGGGAGGISGGLIGVLTGMGLSRSEAEIYRDRLVNGAYVLYLEGTREQISAGESVLRQQPGLQKLTIVATDTSLDQIPLGAQA